MKRILTVGLRCWPAIATAPAQTYPSRPITMVVPFGAGGPTDALARIVAQRMSVTLGQTVLVENVTGASGTHRDRRASRARRRTATRMVLGNWAVVRGQQRDLHDCPTTYANDFEPIARLSDNPYIVVSKNASAGEGLARS